MRDRRVVVAKLPVTGWLSMLGGRRALRAACLATAATLSAAAIPLSAAQPSQDQQDRPLGDIARSARADKQQAQPAPKKVWTNDNLPTNPGAISIVGTPPPPPPEAAAAQGNGPLDLSKPGAIEVKDMTPAQVAEAYPQAKQQLEIMEKELDLAKRDLILQQDAFYADNAKANQDVVGQAKLADKQKDIDAQQIAVDKQRAYVDELFARAAELKINVQPPEAAAPATGSGEIPAPATAPPTTAPSAGASTGTGAATGSASGSTVTPLPRVGGHGGN